MDPVNIELAIFIAEGHQEILNGISVQPEIVTNHSDDVHLLAILGPESICEEDVAVDIKFRNDGNQPLTSMMIEYGIIGGGSNMMEWSGALAPLTSTTSLLVTSLPMNSLTVLIFPFLGIPGPLAGGNGSQFPNRFLRQHIVTAMRLVKPGMIERVVAAPRLQGGHSVI